MFNCNGRRYDTASLSNQSQSETNKSIPVSHSDFIKYPSLREVENLSSIDPRCLAFTRHLKQSGFSFRGLGFWATSLTPYLLSFGGLSAGDMITLDAHWDGSNWKLFKENSSVACGVICLALDYAEICLYNDRDFYWVEMLLLREPPSGCRVEIDGDFILVMREACQS